MTGVQTCALPIYHINYENNPYNIVNWAALDNYGNIYITGATGSFDPQNSFLNYFTEKINSDETEEWKTIYTGDFNTAMAQCIKISVNGNAYVTGGSKRNNNKWEYATIKYAQCPSAANLRSHSVESKPNKAIDEGKIKAYPNPTANEFTIEYSGDINGQIMTTELYNIYGSLIREIQISNKIKCIVNTRDLSSGIYFYRVLIDNNMVGKDKIIISK